MVDLSALALFLIVALAVFFVRHGATLPRHRASLDD
jgi:hypothetical protein